MTHVIKCRSEYSMLDRSERHPRIWWYSSQLHESGRMSKCLRRYVRDVRCCWLGTEQRRAVLLDSDVHWNRRFYKNWCHHSLCAESAKWVSPLSRGLLLGYVALLFLCNTFILTNTIVGGGNCTLHLVKSYIYNFCTHGALWWATYTRL